MGEVWAARLLADSDIDKLVALKTMLPQFEGDPSYGRGFLREASLASHVTHPNVCTVYDRDVSPEN
jgi:serine/threonine protein kinase